MAFLALTALPARAADKWILVATDHFDVVGNTGDTDLRRIAQTLEHFHDVVVDAVLHTSSQSGSRATVLVFKDDYSFTPYKPKGAGRSSIGGLFFLSETNPLLALNAENLAYAFRTVLNGYSRSIAASLSGDVPAWLSSGLGQVYETFEERSGGKAALIGRPDSGMVAFLKGGTPMPLARLTGIRWDDPDLVPGGLQRSRFDAHAWALVHYLSFGPRRSQFAKYMASLHAGTADGQAFAEAFGDTRALESELSDYIRKFLFPALQVVFDEKVTPSLPPRGEVLTEADAEAFLSGLVMRLGDTTQARGRLQKALAATPSSARAAAALAEVEFAENKPLQGMALLEQAAARSPDSQAIQAALGHHLAVYVSSQGASLKPEEVARARTALERAVALEPNDVVATAELGWMLLFEPDDPARAAEMLRKAVTLNRSRDQYQLWLGDAFIRQRKFDEGRSLLGPLMGRGSTPEIRMAARSLMGNISRIMQADEARAAAASRATTAPAPPARASAASPAGSTPAANSADASTFIPALRQVATGETRVLGHFTAATCASGGIVLVIETATGTLNLTTKQFTDVQFITYRSDTPTSIGCGPIRPSQRVLATYRAGQPGASTAGTIVAIELLPDGFEPK